MIPGIVTALTAMVTTFIERRGRINEAKETATIEAIAARAPTLGYMDDMLLWMHAGPIIGVFFPSTREATLEGIASLALLPDWYLAIWFTIVAAVWGAPKLSSIAMKGIRKKS